MRFALHLAGLVVSALFMFATLATADVHACPNGGKASLQHNTAVAALVHASAAELVFVANAVPSRSAGQINSMSCCGPCGGVACTSGHCPACAPALVIFSSGLILEHALPIYGLPVQAALRLGAPPPEFRPPRISA